MNTKISFLRTKWHAIIHELEALVSKEIEIASASNGGFTTTEQVFKHYIELYFQYIMISQDSEDCYDAMIHPQKRDGIKEIVVLIICRIIDLRHNIFKWNPGCLNEGQRGKLTEPFPWEYIDMHKYMSEIKIRPKRLDTPIPSFFAEDELQRRKERNALVEGYMQLKLSTTSIPLVDVRTANTEENSGTEIELGPEGKDQCVFDDSFRESNVRRDKSAVIIQKHVRGHLDRCDIHRNMEKEHTLLGMSTLDDATNDVLKKRVDDMCLKRKHNQMEIDEEYREVVTHLKELVRKEQEFDMRQSLMKERVEWITEQIAITSNIPENLDGFYKSKIDGDQNFTTLQNTEPNTCIEPILVPDKLLRSIQSCLLQYKKTWKDKNVCASSKYDEHVAKDLAVTGEVYNEAKKNVDKALLTNLSRLKALQSTSNGKASGKKGSGKKNKKKGKSSKGKGKKGKGKALPGDKIQALKAMDTAHMLSVLIENKLVNQVEDVNIEDLIGSDLPASSKIGNGRPASSISQLRNLIVEYCILPQGSQKVVDNIDEQHNIRSILLYGGEKSGKTAVVQAITNQTGALLINLSPHQIPEKYLTEKHGTTKLIHMAFSVAKDPKFSPVVLYLDDCDIYFQASKKKKKANAALKLQKDLLIYKNQFLGKNDRVLVIGCSRRPWDAELKTLKWKGSGGKPEKQGFFERSIHIPCPSYADRIAIWKAFIKEKIKTPLDQELNYSLMSQASEGYTGGMIKHCAHNILTKERVLLIKTDKLREEEFTQELKRLFKSVKDEEDLCSKFADSFYSKKIVKEKKKTKAKK